MRVDGSEVTEAGIEVVDPVGLGLMRSVEWLRLILYTFCVEKKAMETGGTRGNRKETGIQSLLACGVCGDRDTAPIIWGYKKAKT